MHIKLRELVSMQLPKISFERLWRGKLEGIISFLIRTKQRSAPITETRKENHIKLSL